MSSAAISPEEKIGQGNSPTQLGFQMGITCLLSPDMTCVLPVGIQSPQGLQAQPKNTHTSNHTCIGETLGFAGEQHASNRIRGFELYVSVSQGILWVFLTVFLPFV